MPTLTRHSHSPSHSNCTDADGSAALPPTGSNEQRNAATAKLSDETAIGSLGTECIFLAGSAGSHCLPCPLHSLTLCFAAVRSVPAPFASPSAAAADRLSIAHNTQRITDTAGNRSRTADGTVLQTRQTCSEEVRAAQGRAGWSLTAWMSCCSG